MNTRTATEMPLLESAASDSLPDRPDGAPSGPAAPNHWMGDVMIDGEHHDIYVTTGGLVFDGCDAACNGREIVVVAIPKDAKDPARHVAEWIEVWRKRAAAHEALDRYIDARRAWVFKGGSSDAVTKADEALTSAALAASTERAPSDPVTVGVKELPEEGS